MVRYMATNTEFAQSALHVCKLSSLMHMSVLGVHAAKIGYNGKNDCAREELYLHHFQMLMKMPMEVTIIMAVTVTTYTGFHYTFTFFLNR